MFGKRSKVTPCHQLLAFHPITLFYPLSYYLEWWSILIIKRLRSISNINLTFALPTDIVLEVASFLDCFDQLKLFHANREFKNIIGEEFWARKIKQQGYLLWDQSLPKVKIFFANCLYEKGFGQHPKLPENILGKTVDVSLLPNFYLAEKSLVLGFPKGKENFRQAQHKITMTRVACTNKSMIFKQKYNPFFSSL